MVHQRGVPGREALRRPAARGQQVRGHPDDRQRGPQQLLGGRQRRPAVPGRLVHLVEDRQQPLVLAR